LSAFPTRSRRAHSARAHPFEGREADQLQTGVNADDLVSLGITLRETTSATLENLNLSTCNVAKGVAVGATALKFQNGPSCFRSCGVNKAS